MEISLRRIHRCVVSIMSIVSSTCLLHQFEEHLFYVPYVPITWLWKFFIFIFLRSAFVSNILGR